MSASAYLFGSLLLSVFVFVSVFLCLHRPAGLGTLIGLCLYLSVCVWPSWLGPTSHLSVSMFVSVCLSPVRVCIFVCVCVFALACLVEASHLSISVFVSVCLSSVCVCIFVCVCVFVLACLVEASHLSRKNQRQQRLAEKQREIRRRGNFSGERTRSGPRDLCVCGR